MNHISLFSGIGGFDLAAHWMGWTNVAHCEKDKFCQKVLKYHFPNSILHEDITTTDFTIYRGKIDILTGGFPCQPFSMAGQRKGTADDRYLWPEMLRAIREIQPTFIVGENVYGLVNWDAGLVFDQVQTDLEAQGYQVAPVILPACSINAPHKRERIWFVAYSYRNGQKRFNRQNEINTSKTRIDALNDIKQIFTTNASFERCNNRSDNRKERYFCTNERFTKKNKSEWNRWQFGIRPISKTTTNTNNTRPQRSKSKIQEPQYNRVKRFGSTQFTTNPNGLRLWNQANRHREPGQPDKTCPGNNWRNFPTQSPICSRNDGLSEQLDGITFSKWRQESIKAYGNAIVPQVALQIFKAIVKTGF